MIYFPLKLPEKGVFAGNLFSTVILSLLAIECGATEPKLETSSALARQFDELVTLKAASKLRFFFAYSEQSAIISMLPKKCADVFTKCDFCSIMPERGDKR